MKKRQQHPLLFEIGDTKPVTSGLHCQRCNVEWYPSQLTVVDAKGQFTKHCPQCHAVLEQRQSRKFSRECSELMTAITAQSCTSDAAFASVTGFSIQPTKLPWLWLGTVSPKIAEACEVLAESRTDRRKLNKIKAQATRAFKRFESTDTVGIAKARRDFVEALRVFCRGLEMRQAK